MANKIISKLKDSLDDAITGYIGCFCFKHDLIFDGWVYGDSGSVGIFGDYYIGFDDIRIDLENDIKKDLFFDWYDLVLGLAHEEKPLINYKTFLKTR